MDLDCKTNRAAADDGCRNGLEAVWTLTVLPASDGTGSDPLGLADEIGGAQAEELTDLDEQKADDLANDGDYGPGLRDLRADSNGNE